MIHQTFWQLTADFISGLTATFISGDFRKKNPQMCNPAGQASSARHAAIMHNINSLFSNQDTATLEQLIVDDKSNGKMPLFVVGTAGGWGEVELMDPVIT